MFPTELISLMRREPGILPYFDLPFQHASPAILNRMGRRGDSARYLDLIHRIRSDLPRAIIRSTFLVGFPGEKEEDFRALRDFQDRAAIDWLGVFPYYKEEGTRAAQHGNAVSRKVARDRKKEIEEAQVPITESRLDRFLGLSMPVLVEEEVKGEGLFLGRGYLQAPDVDGSIVLKGMKQNSVSGRFVNARIQRRNGFDLEAVVLPEARDEEGTILMPSQQDEWI
jgi:ribosomal protein S12 methylthiotransferase